MSMEYPKETLNPQILAEASEWLVEFETGDGDDAARRAFDDWLRRSPEHVRAYLGLLPIWKQGATANFTLDNGPEALIAYARSEANVFAMDVRERAKPGKETRSQWRFAIAAAALLAVVGALFAWRQMAWPTYVTGIGEQHSVLLADGSTLELNARSRIRTRYTDSQRSIDLLEGQALFRVAPDAARPFIVNVDNMRVRAVGTQFDVNKRSSGTVVTVVEGRVSILSPSRSEPSQSGAEGSLLSAGEQATVLPAAPQRSLRPRPANLAAATAWTQRRLVFDASSLAEVVEEFNRYNTRSMIIVDAELGSFPISGTFSSTNPDSLIRFLKAQPGILVVAANEEVRIAARK